MKEKTLQQFLYLAQAINADTAARMEHLPKPARLCGKVVPENLNHMSFEQLCALQSAASDMRSLLVEPPAIILGIPPERVMRAPASHAIGFALWVCREIERINKMFGSTQIAPTPEEQRAGIDRLEFGPFGIVDWYAQRMHIADHDTVMAMPWLRIYKCADIDAQRTRYERRLREEYNRKNTHA